MELLLDTHTLLWLAEGDDKKLSITAREIIDDFNNIKFISIASFWEISIKMSIGKLQLLKGYDSLINYVEESNFQLLFISLNHTKAIQSLELIHRDPFDRILVAQATYENYSIVTADKNIKKYNIKTIW